MATVYSSTIIMQPLSSLSGQYPSSTNGTNGFTTVTVDYNDTVVVYLRSGSSGTTAGTSNYGNTPNGNTSTGGTFVSPSSIQILSSFNQLRKCSGGGTHKRYETETPYWCSKIVLSLLRVFYKIRR